MCLCHEGVFGSFLFNNLHVSFPHFRLAARSGDTITTPAPTPVKAKGERKPKPSSTPGSMCGSDAEEFAQAMSLLASMVPLYLLNSAPGPLFAAYLTDR